MVCQACRNHHWNRRRLHYFLERSLGQIHLYSLPHSDVLQAFDTEITQLGFLPEREWLISSSKSKSIKIWSMPKEWRDARLVADERKQAGKFINEYNKEKLLNTIKKAEEDSDDDDLAGWHLD